MMLPKGLFAAILSFRGFVWAICAIAALYVSVGPLVAEGLAGLNWKVVPCYAVQKPPRYFFDWQGKHYQARRENIWGKPDQNPVIVDEVPANFSVNTNCYVEIDRNGQVGESVLHLDGHKDVGKLAGRAGVALMILGVAFLITRASAKMPLPKSRSVRVGA